MIEISPKLIHPMYDGISYQAVEIANTIYERVKDKDFDVLKRFERKFKPHSFVDFFGNFLFNPERQGYLAGTQRAIYEIAKQKIWKITTVKIINRIITKSS